jgi:hypothetical protein
MDQSRSDSESDDSNPASSVSPTPTVRDSRDLALIDTTTHTSAPVHTGHQVQHQDLGMGRPEVSDVPSLSSGPKLKRDRLDPLSQHPRHCLRPLQCHHGHPSGRLTACRSATISHHLRPSGPARQVPHGLTMRPPLEFPRVCEVYHVAL